LNIYTVTVVSSADFHDVSRLQPMVHSMIGYWHATVFDLSSVSNCISLDGINSILFL